MNISLFSQKQSVTFHVNSPDGKFFVKDADVFSLSPIKISGLKTDADYASFEKLVKKQSVVKKFEYMREINADGTRNATLSITKNDEATIESLFIAINVTQIVINDKTFLVPSQKEEIKSYLKELKEKRKAEKEKEIDKRRSSLTPRTEQPNN